MKWSSLEKDHLFNSLFVTFLLLNIWLAIQIPYTHDDWDWGLDIGIQHLLTADINSRYVGNLIEVLLTRSAYIKIIVMGTVSALIPVVCTQISLICSSYACNEKPDPLIPSCLFLFAAAMLLSTPSDVWRQTSGWVAGFSNFVVSGLALTLFFLLIVAAINPRIDRFFQDKIQDFHYLKRTSAFLVFLFGVSIQLFLENLSIFFFTVALLFAWYCYKSKRNQQIAFSLLTGTTVGLLIMFSSGIYRTLWDTGYAVGTYRHLMYDRNQSIFVFIRDACCRYYSDYIPMMIDHHYLLSLPIAFFLLLTGVERIIHDRPKKGRFVYLGFCLVDVSYTLLFLYNCLYSSPLHEGRVTPAICVFFIFSVSVEILIFFQKTIRFWLLAIWVSPFCIMAPMVLINTVGPRSYYTTNLCLIIVGQILLCSLLSDHDNRRFRAFLFAGAFILCICCGCCKVKVYYPIGVIKQQRDLLIDQINDETNEIIFPSYPNDQYLWVPDPKSAGRLAYFKEFYHIPETVNVVFESQIGES